MRFLAALTLLSCAQEPQIPEWHGCVVVIPECLATYGDGFVEEVQDAADYWMAESAAVSTWGTCSRWVTCEPLGLALDRTSTVLLRISSTMPEMRDPACRANVLRHAYGHSLGYGHEHPDPVMQNPIPECKPIQ